MAAAAIKHMASNSAKLDKFEGMVVMMQPEQIRKRAKWDNDDYVCRGLILNGMSDSLFDIYQNVKSYKELWDSLEAKYMAEDASSKKFFVSNFTNYKMTDSRPVLEQYNELLGILGSYLRIEKSLKIQDSDKPKGNNDTGPSVVNMVEHNNSSRYWFKTYESLNDGSILHIGNESTDLVHGRGYVDLSFMNVNYKVYDLVSCVMNGIVASRVSATDGKQLNFFQDFKSLAKEVDESLAKHKALEYEIERLLRAANDREDIGKLGAKGDIGFLCYSATSCAYRQCMMITFGQPSTAPAAPAPQVLHTQTASTTIADTAPTSINSPPQAVDILNTSQDVDEPQQQHDQAQEIKYNFNLKPIAVNVPQCMSDGVVCVESHLLQPLYKAADIIFHKLWIRRTCIHFINRTNMTINGLRITL
ncbi:hypothetical protein Tco_1368528 [Tanacetum coccineum]